MKKIPVFLIILLSLLVAACGAADSAPTDPTALPYNSEGVDVVEDAEPVVGNADDGKAVFAENCSECHSTAEGEHIEGPSLFDVGSRLDYDEIKESILYPTTHLAYLEDEFEVDDTSMPTDFKELLSRQELEDVIAFLQAQ